MTYGANYRGAFILMGAVTCFTSGVESTRHAAPDAVAMKRHSIALDAKGWCCEMLVGVARFHKAPGHGVARKRPRVHRPGELVQRIGTCVTPTVLTAWRLKTMRQLTTGVEAGATMYVNIAAGGIRCRRFHFLVVGTGGLSLRTTTDGATLGGRGLTLTKLQRSQSS